MKKELTKEKKENKKIQLFEIIGAIVVLFEGIYSHFFFPKNININYRIYFILLVITFALIMKYLSNLYKEENKSKRMTTLIVLFMVILCFSECRFALTSLNFYKQNSYYCSILSSEDKQKCKENEDGKLICHSDSYNYDYTCEK